MGQLKVKKVETEKRLFIAVVIVGIIAIFNIGFEYKEVEQKRDFQIEGLRGFNVFEGFISLDCDKPLVYCNWAVEECDLGALKGSILYYNTSESKMTEYFGGNTTINYAYAMGYGDCTIKYKINKLRMRWL